MVPVLAAGCAIKKTSRVEPGSIPPALESTADRLIEQYNQQARAVRSLNAAVELNPVAGSAYTGVIEDYKDIRGFILAQRPSHIRMIGQAPVVKKNIFDMVSDGQTFRIFIPPKNKFVVGPADLERPARKPIENLRPQHILDAIFWKELPAGRMVLFEEFDAQPQRFYILTLVRESEGPEIARKIWFNRADLGIARMQVYASKGRLISDVRLADWQLAGDVKYPRHIWVVRPHDDYQLELRITKLTLNEDIAADRFRLEQPPGTELVRVGEPGGEDRP